MAVVVLDTNLVSYRMKEHTIAALYEKHIDGQSLVISFMTLAEIHEGALRKGWGLTKLVWLKEELAEYRVIHSTEEIVRSWSEIRAERYRQPIAVDDAWIAATARANGWPLVTHNPVDFRGIEGLKIITEHKPSKERGHA